MKHQKEWHTCDRCGKEIDKLPSQKHILHRKITSPTELKMMCDEKYGYVGDTYLITEDVVYVTIVETHDVKNHLFFVQFSDIMFYPVVKNKAMYFLSHFQCTLNPFFL